jgi:hypothetical protein
MSQKMVLCITTDVRTSNPTFYRCISKLKYVFKLSWWFRVDVDPVFLGIGTVWNCTVLPPFWGKDADYVFRIEVGRVRGLYAEMYPRIQGRGWEVVPSSGQ